MRNDWRTSIGVVERGPMKAVEYESKETYISPKFESRNKENEAVIKEVPAVVKVSADYKSNEYKNKLQDLGFSKMQTNSIYKGIKRIFNNQKSEYSEGFYAIDLNNPKKKFYNGNGEATSVRRPKELLKYITENEKADIITIHNHRADSYPSIEDIYVNAFYQTKCLVVGNKGTIFYCDLAKSDLNVIKFDYEHKKTYNKNEFKEFCKKAKIQFKIIQEVDNYESAKSNHKNSTRN